MNWKTKLEFLERDNLFDPEEELEAQLRVKGQKVAMTNNTSAYIGIDEEANVDVMASYGLGIRLDKETGTMMMVGKKLSMIFEEIDMYSYPFQWRYNKFTVNTLPVYTPGMGMLVPDAAMNLARGVSNIVNKIKNIVGGQ